VLFRNACKGLGRAGCVKYTVPAVAPAAETAWPAPTTDYKTVLDPLELYLDMLDDKTKEKLRLELLWAATLARSGLDRGDCSWDVAALL